jgi:cell division protein FtsW
VAAAFIALLIAGLLAARRAPDRFGFLLGIGCVTILAVPSAMCLLRCTGLVRIHMGALPFLSYGGPDVFLMLVCVGLLLSTGRSADRKATGIGQKENGWLRMAAP